MPVWLIGLLRTLIIILLPVVIVLTDVRLIMSNAYIRYEYGKPDFPADPYGFTQADRLEWAPVALAYLFNDAGIEFLGDLKFAGGSPLYNARELKHMQDVKQVTRGAMIVWIASGLAVMAAGAALAWHPAARPALRAGLTGGAILTIGLLLAIVGYIALNFVDFFTNFHRVFFEGDSWLFQFSDTLIRLFPLKFWADAFTLIGLGAIVEAAAIGLGAWFGLRGGG